MSKLSSLERRRDMLLLLSVLAFGSAADDNLAKEERENCSCFHDQDAVLSILDWRGWRKERESGVLALRR